jgi:hypothetical protein
VFNGHQHRVRCHQELQPSAQKGHGGRPCHHRDRDAHTGGRWLRVPAAPVRRVDIIEAGRQRSSSCDPHCFSGLRHGSSERRGGCTKRQQSRCECRRLPFHVRFSHASPLADARLRRPLRHASKLLRRAPPAHRGTRLRPDCCGRLVLTDVRHVLLGRGFWQRVRGRAGVQPKSSHAHPVSLTYEVATLSPTLR